MECISTVKGVTLVAVAFYTAWWARKTYAYKDKVAELKELLIVLEGINIEAFFHLQLTPIAGSKKTDLGDLLNLIFDFRTKVGSALYIDDEIRTEASAMSSFLEEELVSNIIGIDQTAIDTVRRSFRKLHGSLNAAMEKRLSV